MKLTPSPILEFTWTLCVENKLGTNTWVVAGRGEGEVS